MPQSPQAREALPPAEARVGQSSHGAGQANHGAGKTKQSVGEASGDPPTALPPLAQLVAPETACPGQTDESLSARLAGGDDGLHDQLRAQRGGGSRSRPGRAARRLSDDKASDIIGCGEFSHTACGRAFTYWIEQDGYVQPGGCTAAGENIAWGTGELGTVRSILTAWVNSPEHLTNILQPNTTISASVSRSARSTVTPTPMSG